MESKPQYYGLASIPEEPKKLTFGQISCFYQEGMIRSITYGQIEIIRRIYVALRDNFWNTIPYTISDINTIQSENNFILSFNANHSQNGINFKWKGTIEGSEKGELKFSMEGKTLSFFEYNRIGICILLPLSFKGKPVIITNTDNSIINGVFPVSISPHQPFKFIKSLKGNIDKIINYRLFFEGENFEMEDQRNWTDASFKIYSTPLDNPIPLCAKENTPIFQSVKLQTEILKNLVFSKNNNISISIPSHSKKFLFPEIGLMSTENFSIGPRAIELLQELNLSHCRIEIELKRNDLTSIMQSAAEYCQSIKTQAELALHCNDLQTHDVHKLKRALLLSNIKVKRFCIYDSNKVTSEKTLDTIVPILKEYAPYAKIASGTNNYFVEINRNHPNLLIADEMCYCISPQVHTFDSISIIENLNGILETLTTADNFSSNRKKIITPLTLLPRKNKKIPQKTGGSDYRQKGLFCTAWTMGIISQCILGNAKSLTLYDTTGDNGVITNDGYEVYPVYGIFLWLSIHKESNVIICQSSDQTKISALLIENFTSKFLFLTNLTEEKQFVEVIGLTNEFSMNIISEENYQKIATAPLVWNSIERKHKIDKSKLLKINILPFSIIQIKLF